MKNIARSILAFSILFSLNGMGAYPAATGTSDPPACQFDFNIDGKIDASDFFIFREHWPIRVIPFPSHSPTTTNTPPSSASYDTNQDGKVDVKDLINILGAKTLSPYLLLDFSVYWNRYLPPTMTQTFTLTITPTETDAQSHTETPTASLSNTTIPSETPTQTPTVASTETLSLTITNTETPAPTVTDTFPSTPLPTETFTPTFTSTEYCIPEYRFLIRSLPQACRAGEPFEVTFQEWGGSAWITNFSETPPEGWTVLDNDWGYDYTILPPLDAPAGVYYFYGYTISYHGCNGAVKHDIEGNSSIYLHDKDSSTFTPTITNTSSPVPTHTETATGTMPTNMTPTPTPTPILPNLSLDDVAIELESMGGCFNPPFDLGLAVTINNTGAIQAGTFVVRINEMEDVVQYIQPFRSVRLWFPDYEQGVEQSITIDVYDQIKESNETDNTYIGYPSVLEALPSCTVTPTPVLTPTMTPTSERGYNTAEIRAAPNPARPGVKVILDGTKSKNAYTFQWEVFSSPVFVSITNETSAVASFIAPMVNEPTVITIRLTSVGVCCSPPNFNSVAVGYLNVVIAPP